MAHAPDCTPKNRARGEYPVDCEQCAELAAAIAGLNARPAWDQPGADPQQDMKDHITIALNMSTSRQHP